MATSCGNLATVAEHRLIIFVHPVLSIEKKHTTTTAGFHTRKETETARGLARSDALPVATAPTQIAISLVIRPEARRTLFCHLRPRALGFVPSYRMS